MREIRGTIPLLLEDIQETGFAVHAMLHIAFENRNCAHDPVDE
jgi:hypothetical protein